jgi:hypothetical protein
VTSAVAVKERRPKHHAAPTEAEPDGLDAAAWRVAAGVPLFVSGSFGGGVIQREAADEEAVEDERDEQAIDEAEAAPSSGEGAEDVTVEAAGATESEGEEGRPEGEGESGGPSASGEGASAPPEEGAEPVEVQAALLVGPVDDPFEAEAESVASAVSSRTPVRGPPASRGGVIQRRCAECSAEAGEEEEAAHEPPAIQRLCAECEEEEEREVEPPAQPIRRLPHAGRGSGGAMTIGAALPGSGGAPVPTSVRSRVEPVVGHDLGHVTVHSDHAAHDAAASLKARAFTHQDHIWLGRGQSPHDTRLMAHELTHVVQQGSGGQRRRRSPPPIQRLSFSDVGSAFKRGARWVGNKAKRGFIAIVRRVSETLAEIIDVGPVEWLKRKLTGLLEKLLPGVVALTDIGGIVEGVRGAIGRVVDLVRGLMKGDPKSCQQFRDMLDAVRSVGKAIAESKPVMLLKTVLSTVGKVLGKLYDLIIAPTIDFLGTIVKGVAKVIGEIGSKIVGWFKKIGEIAGRALRWVKEKLGFGTGEGGGNAGVVGWLEGKASAAWNYIKGPFNRVVGPLKTVMKVLFAVTGPGMIYILVKYGPTVVDSVKWLWQHWGERDMAGKAKQHNAGLGKFVATVQGLGEKVQSAVEWVADKIGGLAESALSLLGGLLGIPLLGFVRRGVQALADGAKKLVAWVQGGLRQAGQAIKAFGQRVWKVIEPYKEVLSSVILAIASPPMIPIIIGGWAWQLIPDNCVKYAILDFLLDVMIAVVEALPDTVLFGPLWPLLRRAVLGFLRRLRKMDKETKEKVSNKIAKIISGGSPDFVIGFVKGVFVGVWEGITDPFKAIYLVAEGLVWVTDFFTNLAASALDAAAKKSGAPAPAPATAAAPAPAPAAAPMPAMATASATATRAARSPAGAVPEMEPGEAVSAAAFSSDDLGQLAGEVSGVAGELSPDISTVKNNFWDALREYFRSSDGSFSDLLAKLGEYWEQIKAKMEGLGGDIADKITAFFTTNEAESEIGYGLGWLTGTIAFQLLLDVLTAGAWAVAYPTLAMIARFINWPMEVLGRVFKLLAKLGKYIVEGLKGLGSVIKKAGSGALKAVVEAFGKIGSRLGSFAEQILGRYGSKAGGKAAGLAEREGAKLVRTEATKVAEKRAVATLEKRAAGEVEEQALKKADDAAVREGEQRAAREAEEKAAKGSREAAKEAAELPAALAEARVIETAEELAGLPVDAALASLDLLKAHYSWIKRFEKEPAPGGYMIWLVASKVPVSHYSQRRKGQPTGRPAFTPRQEALQQEIVTKLEAHGLDMRSLGFQSGRDVERFFTRFRTTDEALAVLEHRAELAISKRLQVVEELGEKGGALGSGSGTRPVPGQKVSVKRSHDLGVEGGRLRAVEDGVTVRNWDNPRSHIGDYGRGLDDVGDAAGGRRFILEWKGEGSRYGAGQFGDHWVGRKLAELAHENDPIARELMQSCRNGLLGGRAYRTREVAGGLVTTLDREVAAYNYQTVFDGFLQRWRQLRGGQTLPTGVLTP